MIKRWKLWNKSLPICNLAVHKFNAKFLRISRREVENWWYFLWNDVTCNGCKRSSFHRFLVSNVWKPEIDCVFHRIWFSMKRVILFSLHRLKCYNQSIWLLFPVDSSNLAVCLLLLFSKWSWCRIIKYTIFFFYWS